jgi:hypothetical protein
MSKFYATCAYCQTPFILSSYESLEGYAFSDCDTIGSFGYKVRSMPGKGEQNPQ